MKHAIKARKSEALSSRLAVSLYPMRESTRACQRRRSIIRSLALTVDVLTPNALPEKCRAAVLAQALPL